MSQCDNTPNDVAPLQKSPQPRKSNKEVQKLRYDTDPVYREMKLASSRAWKAKNKERHKAYRAQYYKENKAREKQINKQSQLADLAKFKALKSAADKRYREKHKDKLRQKQRENRDISNQRAMKRYYSEPEFAIICRLRASLTQALRFAKVRKTTRTFTLIGCSPQELCDHLEKQFLPGMTWDNRHLWHVDHIRPCCSFDLTDPEEQKKCFHYTNLRPLWQADNQSKGGKWTQPHKE